MSMIATVFDPDGSQKLKPDGKPLEYRADRELRCLLSAQKAWWPIGAAGKYDPNDPEWGIAPEGAQVYLDKRPKWKMELVPVFSESGELVGTRYDWVDVVQRERNRLAEERLELMRARLGAQQAAPIVVETTEIAYRDTVAFPLPTADGQPFGADAVELKTVEVVQPIAAEEAVLTRKGVEAAGFRTDDEGVTWAKDEPSDAPERGPELKIRKVR